MPFHKSASHIRVVGTTLKAYLGDSNGEWDEERINLDQVLGNTDSKPSSPFLSLPLSSLPTSTH